MDENVSEKSQVQTQEKNEGVEVKIIKKMTVTMTKLPLLFIDANTRVKIALTFNVVTCDGDDWRFVTEFIVCYKIINNRVQKVGGFYLKKDDAISINLIPLEYPYTPKKIFNSQQEADEFAQKLANLLDEKSLLVIDEKNVFIYRNVEEAETLEFPLIARYGDLHIYKVPRQLEDPNVNITIDKIDNMQLYNFKVQFNKQVTLISTSDFNGRAEIIDISNDLSVDFKITSDKDNIVGTLSPGTYLITHPNPKSS